MRPVMSVTVTERPSAPVKLSVRFSHSKLMPSHAASVMLLGVLLQIILKLSIKSAFEILQPCVPMPSAPLLEHNSGSTCAVGHIAR